MLMLALALTGCATVQAVVVPMIVQLIADRLQALVLSSTLPQNQPERNVILLTGMQGLLEYTKAAHEADAEVALAAAIERAKDYAERVHPHKLEGKTFGMYVSDLAGVAATENEAVLGAMEAVRRTYADDPVLSQLEFDFVK